MTQKYLRRAQLAFTSNSTGLDVSDMHFTFQTTMYTWETANVCQVRLYNLDEKSIGRVLGEFTDLILNAGYEENPPTIFEGTIVQVRRGWEGDRAEPYLDITALDGDRALAYQIIADAIPNGSNYKQRWAAIANALKLPIDAMPEESQLPQELQGQQPRGKTLFTNAGDAARDQALHMMCTWSIQRGKIVVIPYDGYLSGQVIDINGYTGMIGWPEQTDDGIHVQCLLDGRLSIGGLVNINNADVMQQQLNLINGDFQGANIAGQDIGRSIISLDGKYKIIELTHSGDTRGNEWYSDLLCLSQDPNQLQETKRVSQGNA